MAGYYRANSKGTTTPYAILVRLSPDDKAVLAKLTHDRQQAASEVIRSLIREAVSPGEVK